MGIFKKTYSPSQTEEKSTLMDDPYNSDLIMGDRYRDTATGVEGVLTSVHFYQHACERGTIRFKNNQGEVVEASFDAPELEHVETETIPKVTRPGGPARAEGGRGIAGV